MVLFPPSMAHSPYALCGPDHRHIASQVVRRPNCPHQEFERDCNVLPGVQATSKRDKVVWLPHPISLDADTTLNLIDVAQRCEPTMVLPRQGITKRCWSVYCVDVSVSRIEVLPFCPEPTMFLVIGMLHSSSVSPQRCLQMNVDSLTVTSGLMPG